MQYIVNDNYKFFMSSFLYLKFDVFIFKYNTVQSKESTYNIFESFKQDIDIDLYFDNNFGVRYSNLIDEISDVISINEVTIAYKKYNNIDIISNDFKIIVDNWCQHVNCIFIKRFDKNKYIIPVMYYFNKNYLDSNMINGIKSINLSNTKEILDNSDELIKLVGKYNMLI